MREHHQVESTSSRPGTSGPLRRTTSRAAVGLGLPDPSVPGPTGLPVDAERIGPVEECGVFGVWAPGEDVAKLTYYGLYALQHRGQEAAGIAVADGEQVLVYKDLGLVSQVFDEKTLESMSGHVGVGHCRYSTTGAASWDNAQPMFRPTPGGGSVVLGHNGNLVNTQELKRYATSIGIRGYSENSTHSDSDIVSTLLAHDAGDGGLEEAAARLLPRLRGAYCLTFSDESTLYAARDPHGVRPLALGRLERGWVVSSETSALDIVGASFVRDIEPGELIAIDADGVRSRRLAEPAPKACVFEYVYLARPDSVINERLVNSARVEIGRTLAAEHPVEGDLVIPVPESGTPAAVGYAQGSGIPFAQGLTKNAYVGRTFIQPSQTIRQLGIRLKLNPLREVIHGKKLVVVDDSIVRGNTQRALIRMLREAGALEVHVRIASPPVRWPCFYGIDFASPAELIANGVDVTDGMLEGVRRAIGADTLGYISVDGMISATGQPRDELCAACFDGHYPIALPDDSPMSAAVLALAAQVDGETPDRHLVLHDTTDAVRRP
ncbi:MULTISPECIES: amidophosphoribosyltransferase [unclassified Dietzia]|uniref:amidophosphoribosyltransferase n=1 Tax=unclassified Dietzia TaxID=2617939 RepID=UPI000D226BFC|nr:MULTISPECIES: amidophosphoribosyltransferase [unclassified Dietzia]AVZ38714.1 amidophosphoribosyltransferase [Dietzia sp. JS16-p6b]MBB1025538.1 amidophosphoribosyltransferase [Dietzia sp. DQ12-76]MBB1028173.1 amidophosphoribosyltransferase [Dietzia sp. DQ11-38-2]QGW23810.1 amidophosphoribosyltransferase [Dietzia sp. DQ12-45-1b]